VSTTYEQNRGNDIAKHYSITMAATGELGAVIASGGGEEWGCYRVGSKNLHYSRKRNRFRYKFLKRVEDENIHSLNNCELANYLLI